MLRSLALALILATLALSSAQAETRDSTCAPTSVRVDERRIEIWCAEPVVLNERSRDRFRVVQRFAFPMVSQNFQPQFGSQVKLLDYYLEVAQNALLNSRRLHIWFESGYSLSQNYGCDPTDCREIVALAITNEPAVTPPESAPLADQ
ncbi:MAG: hypothetical protein O7A98_07345 [Acidobacteria bacterium]|nr:hypothetical protein [Acidobacteriota bacterium]